MSNKCTACFRYGKEGVKESICPVCNNTNTLTKNQKLLQDAYIKLHKVLASLGKTDGTFGMEYCRTFVEFMTDQCSLFADTMKECLKCQKIYDCQDETNFIVEENDNDLKIYLKCPHCGNIQE